MAVMHAEPQAENTVHVQQAQKGGQGPHPVLEHHGKLLDRTAGRLNGFILHDCEKTGWNSLYFTYVLSTRLMMASAC